MASNVHPGHPFRDFPTGDFEEQRKYYSNSMIVQKKLLWGASEEFKLQTQDMNSPDNLTIALIEENEQLVTDKERVLYRKLASLAHFSEGMAVFNKVYYPVNDDQPSYVMKENKPIAYSQRQVQILPLYDFVAFFGDPHRLKTAKLTAANLVNNFQDEMDKINPGSNEIPSCSVRTTISWGKMNPKRNTHDLRWVVQYSLYNYVQQQQILKEAGQIVWRPPTLNDVRVSF